MNIEKSLKELKILPAKGKNREELEKELLEEGLVGERR